MTMQLTTEAKRLELTPSAGFSKKAVTSEVRGSTSMIPRLLLCSCGPSS